MPSKKPLDFTHWERRYGRTLTEQEKAEIQQNLSQFFAVLQEASTDLDLTKVLTPASVDWCRLVRELGGDLPVG